MIYMTFFSFSKLIIIIHPAREAQIAFLIAKKMKILAEYSDFLDVFLEKKTLILSELIKLN